MALVHLANQANAVQRFLVAEMTAQGITGIGRQRDDTAIADEFCSLNQQALLRRIGMNVYNTGHKLTNQTPDRLQVFRQLRQLAEVDVALCRPVKIGTARGVEGIVPGETGEMHDVIG